MKPSAARAAHQYLAQLQSRTAQRTVPSNVRPETLDRGLTIKVLVRLEILQLVESELRQALRRGWSSSVSGAQGGMLYATTDEALRKVQAVLREQASYDYGGEGVRFQLYGWQGGSMVEVQF